MSSKTPNYGFVDCENCKFRNTPKCHKPHSERWWRTHGLVPGCCIEDVDIPKMLSDEARERIVAGRGLNKNEEFIQTILLAKGKNKERVGKCS